MTKFWVLLMSQRPNVPSKNWSNTMRNLHFVHLGQLLGFTYELGSAEKKILIGGPIDTFLGWKLAQR